MQIIKRYRTVTGKFVPMNAMKTNGGEDVEDSFTLTVNGRQLSTRRLGRLTSGESVKGNQ